MRPFFIAARQHVVSVNRDSKACELSFYRLEAEGWRRRLEHCPRLGSSRIPVHPRTVFITPQSLLLVPVEDKRRELSLPERSGDRRREEWDDEGLQRKGAGTERVSDELVYEVTLFERMGCESENEVMAAGAA